MRAFHKLFIFLLIITATLSSSNIAFAQSGTTISTSAIQEKLYVQTDKPNYLCGEIVWLSAYITDASTHQLLSMSKVVYVELLNAANEPVMQTKIAADSGLANGSISLPFTLASGKYALRAYTNWMKNFSAENYFTKEITILNTSSNPESITMVTPNAVEVEFFPEGGDIVNGLSNQIAFKIADSKGKGIDGKGVIVDQNNDTIVSFKSFKFGMGKLAFIPQSGKIYTAQITTSDNQIISSKLPTALNLGYAMNAITQPNGDVAISFSRAGFAANATAYLAVYNQGKLLQTFVVPIVNNSANFLLQKNQLGDGINQLTILNEERQPVSERLYFKKSNNFLQIDANANQNEYGTRSKVNVQVKTNSTGEENPVSHLTATVYQLNNFVGKDEENILTTLWLRPYVRGFIENAEYYFSNNDANASTALDNLLLTQGWRKFDTKNPSTSSFSTLSYIPELMGHVITGRVTNAVTNQPAEGIVVFVSVPGKRIQTQVSVSNKDGFVYFPMKDFYRKSQLVIQTPEVIKDSYRVEIFSPFSERPTITSLSKFFVSENEIGDINQNHLHMQVQNAYHDLNQMEPLQIDSTPFYVKPYKTYYLSDYTRFNTMEEVMREYVTEVNVRRSGNQFKLMTYNDPGFKLRDMQSAVAVFDMDPLVFLDGVPVFDMNRIMEYDPLKVEKLDVIANKYHFGLYSAEGVLVYTTYFGNLEGFNVDPKDVVMDYDGLQTKRIFYSPKYITEQEQSSRLPDFRSVLYWNPTLTAIGNTSFSFFTGDVKGKYLVVIEGLSANGAAGISTFTFGVK